ncbi:MAG: cytochrome c3 family protein, partial [Steroidobacterales bacterium]
QTCAVCHIGNLTTTAGYATLASIPVLHTGITTGCAQCHGGATQLTFYNNNDNPKAAASLSPAHIPAFTGEDCGACHAPSYVAGGFGPMNMTQATHAGVGRSCNGCHEANLSFYMGAASPGLQGRPADHNIGQMVAPNDCSICHTTANWNSSAMPAGHMPNPAIQACNVCHTMAPTDYTPATLAANSVLHTGIATGCAQCHGGSTALTWYNNFTPKDAVLTPSHIPTLAGTDCSSCHSSSTYAVGTFGPMNMTPGKHAFVSTTCITCHETGGFYMGTATPALQLRPADHTSGQMVAPNDCSLCHTTANWNSTVLPTGHMPNPASQACTVCHTTAPANYTPATLAANSVLHTGIGSGCAQCHGGATPLTWYNNFTPKDAVLSPSHIPYLAGTDCSSCHSSSTYAAGTFGPMNMTQARHAFVVTTCDTCHEAGLSYYTGAASPALQGRPADHNAGQMMAPNDCSACHTTANWNSNAMPAGHMPNPANSACTVCHTKAPSDYTTATLAANATLHTGITSGCITCHGAPNAAPPVFYPNYTPKDAVLSPVHIPTSSTPCEDCHATSGFTSFSGTSMSSAKHSLMFTVIGNTCDACHNRVTPALSFYGVTNLTVRPTEDPHNSGNGLTADCSRCHSPNDWGGGAQAKKTVKAPAAPRAAIASVVVAAPASPGPAVAAAATGLKSSSLSVTSPVSHQGVTSNCVSCHDGSLAPGKGAGHIASNNACENCHRISAWLPATFDHQGVTASCTSCHNGAVAPGKPTRHLQANQDCSACHGTLSWTPARFNHVGVIAACQSCHNGITATGMQAQHVVTMRDCSTCHTTLGWSMPTAPAAPLRPLIPAPKPGARAAASGPGG